MHRLRDAKVKVLEVVWNYLYSGREQQAWRELSEMWPAGDEARIHTAILNARARGISGQLDRNSSAPGTKVGKLVQIFDAIHHQSPSGKLEVIPPQPIVLRRPAPAGSLSANSIGSASIMELVIDSAGKVRSAEPAVKGKAADEDLVQAAYGWKFIPAFKSGRAVASRIHLEDSPKQ
jgi:hypothetical protein